MEDVTQLPKNERISITLDSVDATLILRALQTYQTKLTEIKNHSITDGIPLHKETIAEVVTFQNNHIVFLQSYFDGKFNINNNFLLPVIK